MTIPAYQISSEAQEFNWLLCRFAVETAGVRQAIAVSSDGLLIAMSADVARADGDRLAAITSAIVSLANGAARVYRLVERLPEPCQLTALGDPLHAHAADERPANNPTGN